jgi:hypothetical protein
VRVLMWPPNAKLPRSAPAVLNGRCRARNLTGQKYRDNVLAPRVVPHFDNHTLADRPMFMDDNTRPHRARIVQHFLQQEAVQTIPWPAMSPDMNLLNASIVRTCMCKA